MAEKDRIYNCDASKSTEDDWNFEDALEADLVQDDDPPEQGTDLRKKAAWWPVGNQKGTGSCVGWAVGDSVLKYHFVKENLLNADPKDGVSVRYLWIAAKEFDEDAKRPTTFIENAGTSIKTALRIAQRYGVIPTKIWEFDTTDFFKGKFQRFYYIASQLRINGYFNLGAGSEPKNLSNWQKWLAQKGPIATRLNIDDTWRAVGKDGKLQEYAKNPGHKTVGHAVAIVGYIPGKGFIVRNSHGSGWGDKGYAYASEGYAASAFTEAYGVIVTRKLDLEMPSIFRVIQ